jgi:hypothetical protein
MAEEPKGWMKESELLLLRSKQNAEAIQEIKKALDKLTIVVRDLVYIELTETAGGHKTALADHQSALDEMVSIGGTDE